jgi:hypothetical protein
MADKNIDFLNPLIKANQSQESQVDNEYFI